ncbi:hypothetical protein VIOR3934_19810 [Vibrio orientalis CIP 102891 = ATCC 33934]|uniref:Uncharacterized protein n=1 Tax=Vibrio orientalis CIP 102891 = ATCC 33934 TaxID=675816 RepID=C9QG04_VIBOR|nr:hypothetical protein [Vibrio orientalis]EEX94349.1 hypothetical protein VIA_001507 [Vibrio orientalis CIP 102891 = ATCC 33934]EGU54107.1 hypothetical protein VIOR3934_19810 [Vibrio orientalis CIP 102891 = ATCC 33934]
MTNLTWPSAAQTIQASAEQVTDQIGITMNDAVSRLTNLESDANYGRHSLSSEAEALLGLRGDLESLIEQGTIISATPYQYDVGQQLESGCVLTPLQARDTLAAKLQDKIDTHRPNTSTHCIAVMISASNLASFASQLANVTSVLCFPDWMQTARQAKALTTNDQNKMHVPAPIVQPRFKPKATANAQPLYEYEQHQAGQIATLESLANDATNVIGKLSVLAAKRSAKMDELKAQINALKALQGSVWSAKFTGSLDSMASQLKNTNVPTNHQYTIMSLLLSEKPLTFFEELLNA